jgi:hypothetical protein
MGELRSSHIWRFSGNTQMGRRWFKRWRVILNKIKELFYAIMDFYSPLPENRYGHFKFAMPHPIMQTSPSNLHINASGRS